MAHTRGRRGPRAGHGELQGCGLRVVGADVRVDTRRWTDARLGLPLSCSIAQHVVQPRGDAVGFLGRAPSCCMSRWSAWQRPHRHLSDPEAAPVVNVKLKQFNRAQGDAAMQSSCGIRFARAPCFRLDRRVAWSTTKRTHPSQEQGRHRWGQGPMSRRIPQSAPKGLPRARRGRHRAQAAELGRSLKLGQVVPVVWATCSGHSSFRLHVDYSHMFLNYSEARGEPGRRRPCARQRCKFGHPRTPEHRTNGSQRALLSDAYPAAHPHAGAEGQLA